MTAIAQTEMPLVSRTPEQAIRQCLGARIGAEDGGTKRAPNGQEFDIAFVASTEELASDGGVIYVDAWDWEQYARNPRFIANHDLWGDFIPITQIAAGTIVDIEVRSDLEEERALGGKGLVIYVRFAKTAFGQELKTLYQYGDLDAVSVRWDWRTEKARQPYKEEVDKYGDDLHWVVEHAELVEVSAVIVGADPSALALRSEAAAAIERCRKKGIRLPEIEEFLRSLDRQDQEEKVAGENKETRVDGEEPTGSATREVDPAAIADALDGIGSGMEALDLWIRQGLDIRTAIMEGVDALRAAVTGESLVQEGEEEERSEPKVQVSVDTSPILEALNEAVERILARLPQAVETESGEVEDPERDEDPSTQEAVEEAAEEVEGEPEAERIEGEETEGEEEDQDGIDFEAIFGQDEGGE